MGTSLAHRKGRGEGQAGYVMIDRFPPGDWVSDGRYWYGERTSTIYTKMMIGFATLLWGPGGVGVGVREYQRGREEAVRSSSSFITGSEPIITRHRGGVR
jgi:hypothetical protein